MCNPCVMHNPDTIGSAEAAAILGVDRSTVTRQAKAGKLPVKFRGSGRTGELFFSRQRIEKVAAQSSPSSAVSSSDFPPADEGVSSFPTVPQQWTGEPQQGPDGPIRAALTDIATRFPLVPVELADAMDEHGGDAIAFAWISPTGVLLRLELVDGLARTG